MRREEKTQQSTFIYDRRVRPKPKQNGINGEKRDFVVFFFILFFPAFMARFFWVEEYTRTTLQFRPDQTRNRITF